MRSLRNRILFLLGFLFLVAGLFTGLLIREATLTPLGNSLSQKGNQIAHTWEQIVGDKTDLQLDKEITRLSHSVQARVIVYNSQGETVVDSGQSWGESEIRTSDVKVLLATEGEEPYIHLVGNYLYGTFPLLHEKKVTGALQLVQDVRETRGYLTQVWISLAGGMAILFIGSGMIVWRMMNQGTQRIKGYTHSALILAENNLYPGFSAYGHDEVGRLGRAISRMVTSMQQEIRRVRSSEQRLISIFDTMESGLLMVDPKGEIRLANRTFERLTGLRSSDIIGKTYSQITNPTQLIPLIEECVQSETRITGEIRSYFPEERILEARLSPMWAETEGMGVVVVIFDVTAIRHLEKVRTDFVANVSHELKTPVTSLRGFAETLLDGALDDPNTAREFLEIIHRESVRLERLIEDLLNLSHIESKKITLHLTKIPVDQLIDQTVQTLKKQLQQCGLTLKISIPESFLVTVDPDRFHQILLNILSNAINYTVQGGITIEAGRDSDRWWLRITDTGLGIPKEDLPRIFERFYRVDKDRSRASGGTGLGLAIVKHLVEVHQGEISVESEIKKGTNVTLSFPFLDENVGISHEYNERD